MRNPLDTFWDIRAHDREEEAGLRSQIQRIDQQLDLKRRASALRSATGFEEFLGSIKTLAAGVERDLVTTVSADSYMRVLQGKAQALRDIQTLLASPEAITTQLAEERAALQNQLDLTLKRRPAAARNES